MNWTYSQPVEIIFGSNKIDSIYEILHSKNLKNGLLVSTPSLVKNNVAQKIINASKGLIIDIFSNIIPNPTTDLTDECATVIKQKNIEFVVALGGGSCLDLAKAACSICKHEFSIAKVLSKELELDSNHIPLIAIPTTSGTGSEVSSTSVLTDTKTHVKGPIPHNNFFPMLAIIDPVLTLSVPKQVTAATGFDVLTHAIEGFWSIHHQPICDALALHAARLIFDYLLISYNDGSNLEAREKLSEASVIAGLSFTLPKTAAAHACSYPLTSEYGLPHGEACAFTLDSFVRINTNAENGRLITFAKNLGFKDTHEMADKILEMKKAMKLKVTLADADIKECDIETLAEKSLHPNILNNPVKMTKESLIQMYRNLL
jgi:alcohol dehydrogenase